MEVQTPSAYLMVGVLDDTDFQLAGNLMGNHRRKY